MPRKRIERPTGGKTALTFQERITAAHLYFVQGLDQQTIAFAMGVNNVGRVNEACQAIRFGIQNYKQEPREAMRAVDDKPSIKVSLVGVPHGKATETG